MHVVRALTSYALIRMQSLCCTLISSLMRSELWLFFGIGDPNRVSFGGGHVQIIHLERTSNYFLYSCVRSMLLQKHKIPIFDMCVMPDLNEKFGGASLNDHH